MARKQKVGVDGILVLNANCLRYPMLKFQSAAKLWPWRLLVKHEPNTYKLCLKHKLVLTFPSADCKTATILHETLLGWENAIKLSLSFSPHHQHSAKTVNCDLTRGLPLPVTNSCTFSEEKLLKFYRKTFCINIRGTKIIALTTAGKKNTFSPSTLQHKSHEFARLLPDLFLLFLNLAYPHFRSLHKKRQPRHWVASFSQPS